MPPSSAAWRPNWSWTGKAALAALAGIDLAHTDPATDTVSVAYPFSGRPTPYRVELAGGPAVVAMCAIDALGIPQMLDHDAHISSRSTSWSAVAGIGRLSSSLGRPGDEVTGTGMAEDRAGHPPVVEVLYVQDCPHYPATLALVQRVLAELGIDTQVRTTLIGDQATAEQARFAGSPTVRVHGRDVEPGSEPPTEIVVGCRLYRLEHRLAGQPAEAWVRAALRSAVGRS